MVLSFLLLAKTIFAFGGNKSWLAYLASHFRFQYFVAGIVLFVGLLWLNPLWSWLPIIPVVINALFLQNKNTEAPRKDLKSALKVYSANLFIANFHYDKIAASIEQSHADVAFVYEIFEDTFQELQKRLPQYTNNFFIQSPKNLGMAVFTKYPNATFDAQYLSNPKAGTLVANVPQHKNMKIAGFHTDAALTPKKYAGLKAEIAGLAKLAEETKEPLLIVGDFNDTTVSAFFQGLFKAGLKDTRTRFQRAVSWPLFLPRFLGLCLDHALIKNGAHVVNREFGTRTGSDHLPIIVDIAIE